MIIKFTDDDRATLHKLLTEYNEREALRDWVRRCFSTGAKIILTISALVVAIGGVSAGFSWVLGHIK